MESPGGLGCRNPCIKHRHIPKRNSNRLLQAADTEQRQRRVYRTGRSAAWHIRGIHADRLRSPVIFSQHTCSDILRPLIQLHSSSIRATLKPSHPEPCSTRCSLLLNHTYRRTMRLNGSIPSNYSPYKAFPMLVKQSDKYRSHCNLLHRTDGFYHKPTTQINQIIRYS